MTFDSFYFNGNNQYATALDQTAYSIPTTGQLTVSIWVKADRYQFSKAEGSGYVNFFAKSDFSGSTNYVEWQARLYNRTNNETDLRGDEMSFYIFSSTGGVGYSSDVRRQMYNVNRWVHWLATVDDTANYVRLWIDGVLEETQSISAVTPANTPSNVFWAKGDNNGYFAGWLGPAKIWNRVLTEEEIQRQFLINETNTNGLVASWTADNANSRYTDSVSANHGVLTGSPTFTSGTDDYGFKQTPRRQYFPTGTALTLNGSSQYATITDVAQTNLDFGSSDWLVQGWFWPSTFSGHQYLFAKNDTGHSEASNSGAVGVGCIYTNGGSNNAFRLFIQDPSGSLLSTSVNTFRDNKPHHIAMVYRRNPSGRMQYWVDGKYIGGNSPNVTGNLDNDGDFRLGAGSGSSSVNKVNGRMWDWEYHKWSSGTMPQTYQQLIEDGYRYGVAGDTSALVSRWRLRTDGTDSWGTNHLTLVGSPTFTAFPIRS